MYFMKVFIIIISILFVSCSPQKRLNRKVNRAEIFARKHDLLIQDTVKITDTLVIEKYRVDTVNTFKVNDSITVVDNDKVLLKYFYDTITNDIYHEVEVKGDTIIREIEVPVEKIKVVEGDNRYMIIVITLLVLLIIIILRRLFIK